MRLIIDTVKLWRCFSRLSFLILAVMLLVLNDCTAQSVQQSPNKTLQARQRININEGWRFIRYTSQPDNLIYDERPEVTDRNDNVVADTKPTEAVIVGTSEKVLKKWILPTANDFIVGPRAFDCPIMWQIYFLPVIIIEIILCEIKICTRIASRSLVIVCQRVQAAQSPVLKSSMVEIKSK